MAETGSQAQSLLERVEACVAAGQDSQGGAQEAVTRTIELLNALERSKVRGFGFLVLLLHPYGLSLPKFGAAVF